MLPTRNGRTELCRTVGGTVSTALFNSFVHANMLGDDFLDYLYRRQYVLVSFWTQLAFKLHKKRYVIQQHIVLV